MVRGDVGQRGCGGGHVPQVGPQPERTGDLESAGKDPRCRRVAGMARLVCASQVPHHSHHAHQPVLRGGRGEPAEPGPRLSWAAVASHAEVDVQVDVRPGPGDRGRLGDGVEVLHARHRQVDPAAKRRHEVRVDRVEPGEDRRCDPRVPQRQPLLECRDPEPGRPVGQSGLRHREGAVPESVRLHHGHQLTRCDVGERADIGGDGAQVHGEKRTGLGVGVGHRWLDRHVQNARKHARPRPPSEVPTDCPAGQICGPWLLTLGRPPCDISGRPQGSWTS